MRMLDISLIASTVLLPPGVRPIRLAQPGLDYERVAALVTGWGALYTQGPYADILQAQSSTDQSAPLSLVQSSPSDACASSLMP